MDREGFDLIDQQYQKELIEAKRKATEKWSDEYLKKVYIGSKEMQKRARAHDEKELQEKISAQYQAYKNQIEKFHFGEKGRDVLLREVTVQNKERETKIKSDKSIQKQNEDHFLRENGAKNIFELSKKIIQQQEFNISKKRRR